MDLPMKRRQSCRNRVYKKTKSRRKTNPFARLGVNIVNEILDFLQLKEILLIIFKVDLFFRKHAKISTQYRTSLSFNLNLLSEYILKKYINEHQVSKLLSSSKLNRLSLRAFKYPKSKPKNKAIDDVFEMIMKIKSLFELKYLKIDFIDFRVQDIESFLSKTTNLRFLKLSTNAYFPDLISHILDNFFKHPVSIKKLYLKFASFIPSASISDTLEHFLTNPITHFSLKFRTPTAFTLPRLLIQSTSLVHLSLPQDFLISYELSENLCKYLSSNTSLLYLSISATLSSSLKHFVEALHTNRTLKTLKFLSIKQENLKNHELSSVTAVEIFKALRLSQIQDLSMDVFFFINSGLFHDLNEKCLISNRVERFLKAFNSMMNSNKFLRNVSIKLGFVPFEIEKQFYERLVDLARRGRVRKIFGYNFWGLIFGGLKELRIKKRHADLSVESNEFTMLVYLFKHLFPYMNIEKITEDKIFKIKVNTKDLKDRLRRRKQTIFERKKSNLVNVAQYLIGKSIEGVDVVLEENEKRLDERGLFKALSSIPEKRVKFINRLIP